MSRSIQLLLASLAATLAAKKVEDTGPPPNPLVDYVTGLVGPVVTAVLGLTMDAVNIIKGLPNDAVGIFVWLSDLVRKLPDLGKNVFNGDAATLNDLTSFCVDMAGTIFVVYASITALNLALSLLCQVKDYFSPWLNIPTSVPVVGKLPSPVMEVRNVLQKQCLDRIKRWSVNTWIVPLEGHSGTPTLKSALPVLASATSMCMVLSCAPAVHSLMKGGANKAAAEALLYTIGSALGVQWLVNKCC